MSEAPKSTWFWAKEFNPKTDEVTWKLMLKPSRALACPTHWSMATPAKLEPCDWS